MEEIVFLAEPRDVVGKQVKALRRQGRLPAVLYGRHLEAPILVTLDTREVGRVLPSITSSHLIKVAVEGTQHNALVREKQRHPVTGALLHVDFQVVSMTEKLRANVVITLEGDAPAVKNYNGVVVQSLDQLEVESLPGDLPEHIAVNLSSLNEIGDLVRVRDLSLPPQVEVLTDPEEIVVSVTAPVAEEVSPELEGGAEPEVIERGKKEDEEF